MTVYVDRLMNHGWVLRGRRTDSCHLMADTADELHALAAKIGMQRRWAQQSSSGILHYDLVPTKRAAAVAAGAVELSDHEQALRVLRSLKRNTGAL